VPEQLCDYVQHGSFTITPATLTVTADSKSKVYGGAIRRSPTPPAGTLYSGDTYAGVIGDIVLSTADRARAAVAWLASNQGDRRLGGKLRD